MNSRSEYAIVAREAAIDPNLTVEQAGTRLVAIGQALQQAAARRYGLSADELLGEAAAIAIVAKEANLARAALTRTRRCIWHVGPNGEALMETVP